MTNDFLKLDVELLLCRYGRQKVISALAETETCSVRDMEKKLESVRSKRAARANATARKSLIDTLEGNYRDRPGHLAAMRPLVAAYESGTLFPTVKAVQRFLESRGRAALQVKSRRLAGPSVLKALSEMDASELDGLRQNVAGEGQSDYSLLSQAILRGDGG